MKHQRFKYASLEQVTHSLKEINSELLPTGDISILNTPIKTKTRTIHNRIAFQAMEGCDGKADGSPDELTLRRYKRFAASGAGFMYVEATAVVPEGRANPRQLMITENNLNTFADMVAEMRKTAQENNLPDPYIAIQLTHSGRYSKDENFHPAPKVACADAERDPKGVTPVVLTDEYFDALPNFYVKAATLAKKAGFDCVDVKCCHGYLLGELMGAHAREGKYGGSFENRSRLIDTITRRIRDEVGIEMMVRMSGYDEYPYPYGFGVDKDNFRVPDLEEPKKLVDLLIKNGVAIIDITAGNPYYNPHVNRPYDMGTYIPPVSQQEQLLKHWKSVRDLKAHNPNAVFISSMLTWHRQYGANIGAAGVEQGWFDMAGFGRQSFAYPEFPKDLFEKGEMDPKKCCICCSKCTALMRAGQVAGCVVRDKVYTEIYAAVPKEKRMVNSDEIGEKV